MSFLKKKPATLVLINDIDPARDNYKVKVKVLRLWKSWRNTKLVSIEVIFVDSVVSVISFYFGRHAEVMRKHILIRFYVFVSAGHKDPCIYRRTLPT